MAFTYNDDQSDARSRLRFAVGDIASPGLFPDATYDAKLAHTTVRRQSFACAASTDVFTAEAHGLSDGTAVILADLTAAIGISAGVIRYVRDAGDDIFALALTVTGTAIDLVADGEGSIGVVDEAAAIREIARGLAARYASEPDSISDNGTALTWRERIAHWNRIATGDAGGASARRAKGFTLRRGPARDYTTGGGDAT
jgi:hypothetical protein